MDRDVIALLVAEHAPSTCLMVFIVTTQFIATVRLAIEQWQKRQERRAGKS